LTSNPPLADPRSFTRRLITFAKRRHVARAAGLSPNTVDPNFDNAYVQSWNLNIQRELGRDLGVTIGYFGRRERTSESRETSISRSTAARDRFRVVSAQDPIRPNVQSC
jgi:hypothetical protein